MPNRSPKDARMVETRYVRSPPIRRRPPTESLSDVELLAEIGRDLKSVYAEVLHEPLPDHLATLLRRLDTSHLTTR